MVHDVRALASIINAVNNALDKYSYTDVDVIRNEETGMVDIIYHSDRNSFPIQSGVVDFERLSEFDKKVLVCMLNERSVGYCW